MFLDCGKEPKDPEKTHTSPTQIWEDIAYTWSESVIISNLNKRLFHRQIIAILYIGLVLNWMFSIESKSGWMYKMKGTAV